MNKKEKVRILHEMPLFKNCSDNTLEKIANDIYIKNYEKGDWILTSESAIHKIAIIANEGRMKIFTTNTDADEFIVYCLMFGDLFNVITLLDEKKDNLNAVALDDLKIFHCNIDIARNWIRGCEDFNKNLLRYLSERLRMAIEHNIQKTFYSVELRLAKLIFDNVTSDDNQLNLINDLPHEEIAKMLGTSRAVVNRNLQKLKKDKLIEIMRKKILIHDYEKMKEYIASHPLL